MISIDFDDEIEKSWRDIFRSIARSFWGDFKRKARALPKQRAKRTGGKTFPSFDDNPRLHKAFLTVLMAANPGEEFDAVAARIDKEANDYRTFLENPLPIGKISLNLKQLPCEANREELPCQPYQVRNPAEGQAYVSYNIKRSNRLVLEFIVYDQKNQPLFPIVRTYSDWIGKKKFNLGLGRIFHLNMVEDDEPGFVRVEAGFAPLPARERKSSRQASATTVQPVAARNVTNGNELKYATRAVFSSHGNRFAFALGVNFLFVACMCLVLLGLAVPDPSVLAHEHNNMESSVLGSALPVDSVNKEDTPLNEPDLKPQTEMLAEQTGKETNINSVSHASRNGKKQPLKSEKMRREKAAPLAAMTQLRVVIDDSACQVAESRCKNLLASLQQTLKAKLGKLNLHVYTPDPSGDAQGSNQLVVSYKPVDDCIGHVYVTLYDQKGLLLWGADEDCLEYGGGHENDFINDSSETFASKLAEKIKEAREVVKPEVAENSGESTQKGERSSLTD